MEEIHFTIVQANGKSLDIRLDRDCRMLDLKQAIAKSAWQVPVACQSFAKGTEFLKCKDYAKLSSIFSETEVIMTLVLDLSLLLESLQSTSAGKRASALEGLANLGTRTAGSQVTTVCAMLENDEDARVRKAAAITLPKVVDCFDDETLCLLLKRYNEEQDKAVHEAIKLALKTVSGEQADQVFEAVLSQLESADPESRRKGLIALASIAKPGHSRGIAAARNMLTDAVQSTRWQALVTLRELVMGGDEDTISAATKCLYDESHFVKQEALKLLVQFYPDRAAEFQAMMEGRTAEFQAMMEGRTAETRVCSIEARPDACEGSADYEGSAEFIQCLAEKELLQRSDRCFEESFISASCMSSSSMQGSQSSVDEHVFYQVRSEDIQNCKELDRYVSDPSAPAWVREKPQRCPVMMVPCASKLNARELRHRRATGECVDKWYWLDGDLQSGSVRWQEFDFQEEEVLTKAFWIDKNGKNDACIIAELGFPDRKYAVCSAPISDAVVLLNDEAIAVGLAKGVKYAKVIAGLSLDYWSVPLQDDLPLTPVSHPEAVPHLPLPSQSKKEGSGCTGCTSGIRMMLWGGTRIRR
jgi:hypothetical protein